eukprot:CAMPEP_0184482370 /NCGR_PEP_ID=MMETSP0113_2-20130426/3935_1 /TAXON_ID=91329 /ORGANISM="Norrisiella sphaerica, Strain BC52" /LENGTH=512 /DNA_ID=CAMNT_0026862063 /DNA_START=285 /DNA_END=1823 /DNA_ORIENTATION=-
MERPEIVLRGDIRAAKVLEEALWLQWKHGYPRTPMGFPQLTHGYHAYPAQLQPKAAHILLDLLPGRVLYDPFVGGGTSIIEAMRKGYQAYGTDISPLAVFVSQFHTWRPSLREVEELKKAVDDIVMELRVAAENIFRNKQPIDAERHGQSSGNHFSAIRLEDLRDAVNARGLRCESFEVQRALWFILSALVHRGQLRRQGRGGNNKARKGRDAYGADLQGPATEAVEFHDLVTAYRNMAREYLKRLQSFSEMVGDGVPDPYIARGDATEDILKVFEEERRRSKNGLFVDAVLTSPPYPAVYDYLSVAREARSRLGGESEPLVNPETGAADFRRRLVTSVGTSDFAGTPLPKLARRGGARVQWPEEWRNGEMGSKRELRRDKSPLAYAETWAHDHEAWLRGVKNILRIGGRCAVIIGDSDAGWIDTLESTEDAASLVGLTVKASASIFGSPSRQRKSPRTEHAILLENTMEGFPPENVVATRRAAQTAKRKAREEAASIRRSKFSLRTWFRER